MHSCLLCLWLFHTLVCLPSVPIHCKYHALLSVNEVRTLFGHSPNADIVQVDSEMFITFYVVFLIEDCPPLSKAKYYTLV